MLLGLAIVVITVLRIVECSSALKGDEEDGGLFRALDKELEEFLEEALDDLPQKLDDVALQNVEASGEMLPVTAASEAFTTTASFISSTATVTETSSISSMDSAEQKVLNASDASMLLQLLTSMAMTNLPAQPGVREMADQIVAEAINDEVMALLSNATTATKTPSETPYTVPPLTSEPSITPLPTSATPPAAALLASFWVPNVQRVRGTSLTINAIESSEQKRSTCINDAVCYSDDECGQGQCHGVSLGKCNCHACLTNTPCIDDTQCGGLLKSCQNGSCKCAEALAKHGYHLFIVAMTNFCSQRKCTVDSDSCFGLPCNYGTCSCLEAIV